jgi:hypothetical protein
MKQSQFTKCTEVLAIQKNRKTPFAILPNDSIMA